MPNPKHPKRHAEPTPATSSSDQQADHHDSSNSRTTSQASGGPVQAWQQGMAGDTESGALETKQMTNPFKSFVGYEAVVPGSACLMPPPGKRSRQTGKPPKMEFVNLDNLNESECRNVLLEYVSQQCCYGSSAAKGMTIPRIEPTSALHYILESYTEGRSASYASEPYMDGTTVDGAEQGDPPLAWDMPCTPDDMFTDQVKVVEVPHTSSVQECHTCRAGGVVRCDRCHGKTHVRCNNCQGRGQVRARGKQMTERCGVCRGDGRKRCGRCQGMGQMQCLVCLGLCRLRTFILLTVSFANNQADHILEETDMPDELIRDVTGSTVLEQVMEQVWPITGYTVNDINENSAKLVEKHNTAFPNERLVMQRQTLRAVPVVEVTCLWKHVSTRYWIYGRERKIYAPDYPQTCCWGCNIL